MASNIVLSQGTVQKCKFNLVWNEYYDQELDILNKEMHTRMSEGEAN